MKILLVIDSLGSGGAQRQYVNLANVLSSRGHQVEIFIYIPNNKFYEKHFLSTEIKIHEANKICRGFSWQVMKELRKLIKDGYDGIISSMHAPSIYTALGKFGLSKGKLIVCEVSSSLAPVPKFRKFLFYLSSLLADVVVTNSFHESEIMKKEFGLSSKVVTIWNGYDIPSTFVSHVNNSKKINKLLIVGRIAYPKNGVNLLKGLSLFLSRNHRIPEIYWAGREDTDDLSIQMQKEMAQYLVENPEIALKFKMLGEVKNINELYLSSDALIHVSIYEGLPNVICEAMIIGCPVIASNVCDHPKVLQQGHSGLLCEPFSPESICIAIEKFESMSIDQRKQLAVNARKFAEKNFGIDQMADGFENLLLGKMV